MEIFFLLMLIVLMVVALASGYPVAFALPGSAIATIAFAALAGTLVQGDASAYFSHGGPVQWLNAGVTNLRGVYWEAERDTLIAIPLFIFMGLMLERSKIAEDLLVTMGQLFGPVPGGLGISVVLVGALLAATTGIVGATVIAMGLISLPVMLRANYAHSLATGTIAASGTLGQIIPPSIVLIILADQLSNATDQASAIRTAEFKQATGQFTLPSAFDVSSTSAGDMFLGAFLPGLVLVGLYVGYILTVALISPKRAPAAPREGGMDRKFAAQVLLVLVPPLALIFAVLGSIILGVATVNQAGAIGAVGALIMAGFRLNLGKRGAFIPALLAVLSVFALIVLVSVFDINVKNIRTGEDRLAIVLASVAVAIFLIAIICSIWQVHTTGKALHFVMLETAKTTSLVFIILLGAAMLTAAFRAFGGEELVRDFLSGLPGGFAAKFIVVMAVIFLLGFFLDFIEIAVVVVPIIAPILLADPTANITAVWLGVMIGVNMQTSFLTPPFGFALFYLRGVADKVVRTIDMYRGVVPFIGLQLAGLLIVGLLPPLVNYLPNRVQLTSETAPPPRNPRLQLCIENHLFERYKSEQAALKAHIDTMRRQDVSALPERRRRELGQALSRAAQTFALVDQVERAAQDVAAYVPEYRPLHLEMRALRLRIAARERDLKRLKGRRLKSDEARIARLEGELAALKTKTPEGWEAARKKYLALARAERQARLAYRRNVDQAYEPVAGLRQVLAQTAALEAQGDGLKAVRIDESDFEKTAETIRAASRRFNALKDTNAIRRALSQARRAVRGRNLDPAKARAQLERAVSAYEAELAWRKRAAQSLDAPLRRYDQAIKDTIGLRLQPRLDSTQARAVAACLSYHRDISLSF